MANSKYEYVKDFEAQPTLLKSTYIVVRIDGRGFHKFSTKYDFAKPNDRRALDLMNAAATAVMKDLPDIGLAYGVSDEFSFIFDPSCKLFERRESKIVTTVVSTFTSYYVHLWPTCFPSSLPLSPPLPSFDGRAVCYPREDIVRDYMRWRQVDCHINNLYNTTFWAMVQKGGMGTTEAEAELKGTISGDKNEILFSRFGINYNNEESIFKKGSVVYRNCRGDQQSAGVTYLENSGEVDGKGSCLSKTRKEKEQKRRAKAAIVIEHVDIIKDEFWETRPWLLGRNSCEGKSYAREL